MADVWPGRNRFRRSWLMKQWPGFSPFYRETIVVFSFGRICGKLPAMTPVLRNLWLVPLLAALPASAALLDTLTFGNAASETAHHFSDSRSETISGGLGEPARRLLPPAP